MKIITIASNVEGNIDGIGKHARILTEEYIRRGHDAFIIDGITWNKSTIGKLFSLEMTKCIFKTSSIVTKDKTDLVIYEYPFAEFNPFIILPIIWLYFVTRFTNTKIALSMHEFDRVNFLRKCIIFIFLVFSDVVYVSETKYIERFKLFANKMYHRTIPNHIVRPSFEKNIDKTKYTYFGLINRAKAFQEMIDAWNEFNKEGKYQLDVITCSDYSQWDNEQNKNISFHFDLPGDEVASILYKSAFTLIPVIPNIGLNNSSFMSGIQCGCVPIGIFNETVLHNNFIINQIDYSLDNYLSVLESTQELDDMTLKTMSDDAMKFGSPYTVENTVSMMLSAFRNDQKQ